jgi:hypothetical protein
MAIVRVRDYAKKNGVTASAIYLAIEQGLLTRQGRGPIDEEQADAVWGRRLHRRGRTRVSLFLSPSASRCANFWKRRRAPPALDRGHWRAMIPTAEDGGDACKSTSRDGGSR